MARLSSIPPKLWQEIMDLAAEGLSRQKIANALNSKYGTNYDDSAVEKIKNKLIKERQAIAQEILTEKLNESAARDINILNDMVISLKQQYQKAISDDNIELSLKISAQLKIWHNTSLELTGLNSKNNDNTPQLINSENIIDDLLQKLN